MRGKLLTQRQVNKIIKLYTKERKSSLDISKIMKLSKSFILKTLKSKGITRRTLKQAKKINLIDFSFFKKINTEEKAYFLGLMYADGYNSGKSVHIMLQKEDGYILEKFRTAIKHPLNLKFALNSSRNSKWKDMVRFNVCSKEVSEDLSKLGCVKKKSLILKFPTKEQVPEHLINHFIRGYFDGDGSVGIARTKNKKHKHGIQFGFTSSKDFIVFLKNFFSKKNINFCIRQRFKTCEAYSLQGGGPRSAFLLYKFLYKDASPDLFLLRKKAIFENLLFKEMNYSIDGFKNNQSSKYRGIYKKNNKWEAQFCYKKIKYHLGYFKSELDAAKAYDLKIKEITGNDHKLNFPDYTI